MKQLYRINIMMNISIILILYFYIQIVEGINQNVIIQTIDSETSQANTYNEYVLEIRDNGCECIKYNCGCCQFIEWDTVSLNGTLCANASYLEYDYGFSVTVTYNNFAIINETVSGRNPPPFCVGEDIVDAIEIEICLHMYDIDINDKFHGCFEILGKIMKFRFFKLKLGCINNLIPFEIPKNSSSLLFEKKKYSILLIVSVIMYLVYLAFV
ncbi:uncharacterized protein [Polyergus mexicanus]|uniref:uncharacterized protein n=1 Tax=Polyergus mexicanus TaxID=615972 RepID=UPI0038B4805E